MKEVEDFLVLTVKDYPLGENLTDWNDDGPVLTPVDFNKKYNINMGLDILPHNGVGGDALIIWDDVQVKDSGNVIYSEDFQYYENCGYLENRTKNESGDYRGKIYTTSLLSLKSKKANIKVGKSTKINSTSIAGTTVTYKSNKPKVASVDKNGNVKGLKKGKAVISVSCCGKTLKYTVTVK